MGKGKILTNRVPLTLSVYYSFRGTKEERMGGGKDFLGKCKGEKGKANMEVRARSSGCTAAPNRSILEQLFVIVKG
jgi:hypothetical protein